LRLGDQGKTSVYCNLRVYYTISLDP
jgi:hypothetical protein